MKFFVVERHPKADKAFALTEFHPLPPVNRGEAPRCPACGGYIGALPLLPPVRVEVETWGTDFGDIAFGPGEELLVSNRFWELYQRSGLTGLVDVGSVEVAKQQSHQKLGNPAPRYQCCRIARSRAAVDDSTSGLEREQPPTCEECRLGGIIKRARRLFLEPNSWSGEDVFFARGLPGIVFVSERFESFCQENQISNCSLVRAEEFSFDHYPWEEDHEPLPAKRFEGS